MYAKIYTRLDELPPSFAPLFASAACDSIFFSLPWFQNLVETVFTDRALRIYTVERDSTQAFGALVMQTTSAARGLLHPASLNGLANYYSSLYSPILANDANARDVLHRLVEGVARDSTRWDVIDLNPLAQNTPVFTQLQEALGAHGYATQPYFCFGNWYLDVAGRNFAEYRKSLPSQLQNTVNRKFKKLQKTHQYRIDIVTGGDKLDRAISDFIGVYNRSWKKPEPFPNFIPGFVSLCAKQGWLRLGVIYIDDVPAAAQLWTVHNGIAYIFKLAYDERYAEHSAGSILTMHLFEHVIDVDKVNEIDYLTGDDGYKKDWMSGRRERWGIRAYNRRSLLGLAGIAGSLGKERLKRLLRR